MTDHQLYQALKELTGKAGKKVSVKSVCSKLGLNRSNYYDYFKRPESEQSRRHRELTAKIKKIHEDSKEIYGAPKITRKLRREGEAVSQKKVANIMRENGWKAHYSKPWTKTTKNCDFSSELENVLNREFNPEAPNRIWCTDITYIWTLDDGFVYLTSIMDLFSRRIVAWTLSKTMTASEVLKCLETAKKRRYMDEALVIHSDRGSQYVSKRYKELTSQMKTSYSDKGNPWDNACIEAFHALIKREWLNKYTIRNYEHATALVFEYIDGIYNSWRMHSHCDYYSPMEFEQRYLTQSAA